jgi:hypothetical protein
MDYEEKVDYYLDKEYPPSFVYVYVTQGYKEESG